MISTVRCMRGHHFGQACACLQAGENNARVQAAAVEALLHLAGIEDAALTSQAALFVRPEKQTQWKRILGRYSSDDRHPPDLQAPSSFQLQMASGMMTSSH